MNVEHSIWNELKKVFFLCDIFRLSEKHISKNSAKRIFQKEIEWNRMKKNILIVKKRCKSATCIEFLKFNIETNVHFGGETISYSFKLSKKL